IVSLGLALGVKAITGLRVPQEVEISGIDTFAHGESAYAFDSTESEQSEEREPVAAR
ncbi:MAG: ammonium transporter, partial [Microbacteriaceae bacterium]|nr:ammonium transporter [Microbacteriaceae bacterium]